LNERNERNERTQQLLEFAKSVKGFMPVDEGTALFEAALSVGPAGAGGGGGVGSAGSPAGAATLVEVGAWCGKSTVYLGAACEATGSVLFSIDHHHGSEENQSGWEHHDDEVVDTSTGRIDTLPFWRRTIDQAGLGSTVVGMVGDSPVIAAQWSTPVDLCFIDGGHGEAPAWADFRGWAPKVAVGGLLAIHDVFPDPADGGRPPYELWSAALESGEFEEAGEQGSLRILRRISPAAPG